MKFSWGQQETIPSDIANQAAAWVAHRSPTWLTYTAPDLATVYTRSNGRQMSLGNFWTRAREQSRARPFFGSPTQVARCGRRRIPANLFPPPAS